MLACCCIGTWADCSIAIQQPKVETAQWTNAAQGEQFVILLSIKHYRARCEGKPPLPKLQSQHFFHIPYKQRRQRWKRGLDGILMACLNLMLGIPYVFFFTESSHKGSRLEEWCPPFSLMKITRDRLTMFGCRWSRDKQKRVHSGNPFTKLHDGHSSD